MSLNLRSLIDKLNDTTRTALSNGVGLCHMRTHYDVEVEHYLSKLLDSNGGDLDQILRHFEVNRPKLSSHLEGSLDGLKSGTARTPAFSPQLLKMLTESWTLASIDFEASTIRSGVTVLALVKNDELRRMVYETSAEFRKIDAETLSKTFSDIVAGSNEEPSGEPSLQPSESDEAVSISKAKTPHLDQYTIDLTGEAKLGRIDPVLARDEEIRQVIDILTRRRQNNPILVGEAGVGKTAVAEGFALKVVSGDVPPPLRKVRIHTLDLSLLQAGAGVKGEFENRLKGLISEVKSSITPIILFIDEAHTMIGAGGEAGQGDAANLLKPALARGELRTIAATTWAEYKKYFEKDAALARRFQPVKVDEPSEEHCNVMLRGLVSSLESHHQVRVLSEGVEAAVRLSHRYLPDRQLPDKAVSVLDTASARVALAQTATPSAIEDTQRRLDDLAVQTRVLERESELGVDHKERLGELATEMERTQKELDELNERWRAALDLVKGIQEIRQKLETGSARSRKAEEVNERGEDAERKDEEAKSPDVLRQELKRLTEELESLQGERTLVKITVDAPTVAEVVSGWTGIPVGKMVKDEIQTILELESHLKQRVIGQDDALSALSQRIRTSTAGLEDPNKPVGVFLLVGPSGVGKSETALALSDLLYGGERNLITINMSEFQEAHTVSSLKGSPPGYVGYGEGGVLTEAVRRRPYSVVLLDEVEKAHPDVLEVFFQVFDKGVMEDGEGRQIDFKNSIIILTSNAGVDTVMRLSSDPGGAPSGEELARALKPELGLIFKPAFLGRLVVIPYFPLGPESLKNIISLKLGRIRSRINEIHQVDLNFDENLVEEIAKRCTEIESGARNIDNILTNTLLPEVSRRMLSSMANDDKPGAVTVGVSENGSFVYA